MTKWLWVVLLACCMAGQMYAQNSTLSDADIQCILDRIQKDNKWLSGDTHPVTSSMDLQLYGYIKLDAAYDTTQITDGNTAYYVQSRSTANRRDDQMNITARQTRLGLKLKGPDFGEATTSGQVEIDFYDGGAENKAEPYMRHAYMKLEWPKDDFHILAGQYWDVISPLVPTTLFYHVQWLAGDIGYRRPQIRIHKGFGNFALTGAISRTIGTANTVANPGPGDTGEDSGVPTAQARAAFTFNMGERKGTLGISGHYGLEEWEFLTQSKNVEVPSWTGNLDLTLPVTDTVSIKGEYYIGKNTSSYLGGIGQGVIIDNTNHKITPIKARGGWGSINLKPADCDWCFNVGASADHISDTDAALLRMVTSTDPRIRNFSVYGNAIYNINSAASWGIEVSRWRTGYEVAKSGDALRVQTSFIFKF
ncbi:MAG: hypothetical protein KJ645_06890 [Planctomycetes bacterium]|nr:hypothetical protein [Planctomycetota bacterium]